MRQVLIFAFLLLISIAFAGCGAGSDANSMSGERVAAAAPILLFNGIGTSAGDVVAVERILKSHHVNYATVNSSQLNGMSESQIGNHRLLIVPGGNFIQIGNGLTSNTTTNIRSAVQNGLNYLGICAGAFFAGNSPSNGLNLTAGVKFAFYAAEGQGIRKAAVPITLARGATLDHYWEDGPQLSGWGAVIGKYPDGTAAIVQGAFGSGSVVLTGVHPEAPTSWRRGMTFTTSADFDNDYAWTLIEAALNRAPLPNF